MVKSSKTNQPYGETMTKKLAEVGEFCPNEDCEVYGQIKDGCISSWWQN
jgi:hypothetical protein